MKANVNMMGFKGITEAIKEENGFTVLINNKHFFISNNSQTESVEIIREVADLVENENKITIVINFDYDNESVKVYSAPKSFGLTSFKNFDNKVDSWLDRVIKEDSTELQTICYLYKFVKYTSLEDLYNDYSRDEIDGNEW